jgi:hypothetical protein
MRQESISAMQAMREENASIKSQILELEHSRRRQNPPHYQHDHDSVRHRSDNYLGSGSSRHTRSPCAHAGRGNSPGRSRGPSRGPSHGHSRGRSPGRSRGFSPCRNHEVSRDFSPPVVSRNPFRKRSWAAGVGKHRVPETDIRPSHRGFAGVRGVDNAAARGHRRVQSERRHRSPTSDEYWGL